MRLFILTVLMLIVAPAMAQTEKEVVDLYTSAASGLREYGVSEERAEAIAKEHTRFSAELRALVVDAYKEICSNRKFYESSPRDLARILDGVDAETTVRKEAYAEKLYAELTAEDKEALAASAEESVTIIRHEGPQTIVGLLEAGRMDAAKLLNKICGETP